MFMLFITSKPVGWGVKRGKFKRYRLFRMGRVCILLSNRYWGRMGAWWIMAGEDTATIDVS